VKGGDWELILGEEDRLEGREKLPVLVTLNLVSPFSNTTARSAARYHQIVLNRVCVGTR
jgi:hypothetical protein